MKIVYFAWLRERTGLTEEDVAPPATVKDVGGLVTWLATRSDGHARAFAEPGQIRAAVNQEYARLDHPVAAGDEIAFFPPVTGG